MQDHFQKHIIITDEVKKIVNEHKIIFPAYYGKVYTDVSKKYDIELSASELLHEEMIDEKIVRHIITLSENASLAIEAMETENHEKLLTVLQETKSLHEEINKLRQVVYEDTLTRCYNRRWFEDKYLDDSNTNFSKSGTLIFVDLNRLKRINDTYGHITGDRVIKYLALKLKEIIPSVVRYGGDEFLLMFDEILLEHDIEKLMNTTLHFFNKTTFKSEHEEFKVSFAYGAATFEKGALLNITLDKADKKMYILKEGSRSSVG